MSDRDQIKKELLALKSNNNEMIHVENVVEWARDHPDSKLHSQFEWDDAIAGHQYRLWQARRLVAIHVVSEKGERKFISLTIDRKAGGGYRDIDQVARVPDMRAIMLRDALSDLRRVREKYKYVKELADVWTAIDRHGDDEESINVA